MADYVKYRIGLNEDWSLEDLYVFPRAYEQVYFFYTSLSFEIDDRQRDKIAYAYQSMPWQGGYSAVNFFNQLKISTPVQGRPKVISIQKSSPGYLDLGLWLFGASQVAKVVKNIAATINTCNETYGNIYNAMQEKKLLRLKVEREGLKFEQEQLEFIKASSRQMARILGFRSPAEIDKLTGHPYKTLKLLFSVYRRLRTLSKYENDGKVTLGEDTIPIPAPPRQRSVRRKARDI